MKAKYWLAPTALMMAGFVKSGKLRPLANSVMPPLIDLINQQKRGEMDYVLIDLPATMPAFPSQMNPLMRRFLGEPPISLVELELLFERVAKSSQVRGVILNISGLMMSLADLQSLRQIILRLREQNKRVLAFSFRYDTASYYVASAADEILLQKGGELWPIGLANSATFLKDALDSVGITVDSVAISPYKSAADAFTQAGPTPEFEAQINWLLDSRYEQVIAGIANGRGLSEDAARQLIDTAPHIDTAALERGYVDGILNADDLPAYLDAKHIVPLENAKNLLPIVWRNLREQYIAVVSLSGMIVDGESQKPPRDVPLPIFGAEQMGSQTVVQQMRSLAKNEDVAAVVLHIDSPGGSATASEAMCAAMEDLAREKPIVVFMNGVAASGGYYISTPAQWIVAQPGTITGSIGVIMAKVVNSELLDKLKFNAVPFSRGANMEIFSTQQPFTDEQRAIMETSIRHTYAQFLERVALSRQMNAEQVDEIGGGRVWTGQQAFENGLVDELGGLKAALRKARELANLPDDNPALLIPPPKKAIGPRFTEATDPAASLRYAYNAMQHTLDGSAQFLLPFDFS